MNFSQILRLCACLVALFFVANSAFAQLEKNIPVGLQPVSIIYANSLVHVFCEGQDMNFNGIIDAGDTPSSWWIIDPATNTVRSHINFEQGFLQFPFRAAMSANVLFVSHLGRVRSFNIKTQKLAQDTVATASAGSQIRGLAFLNNILYMSVTKDYTNPGVVLAYNTFTKMMLDSTSAFANTQQIVLFTTSLNKSGRLVLSEGTFGNQDSKLQISKLDSSGKFITKALNLGNAGNHIYVRGDSAFVCVNGSNNIVVVDLNSESVVRTISVGTSGFNGPRESTSIGDDLFVTTYNSDVRRFSISTGELTETFSTGSKSEGITVINGKLWIANEYQKDSYTNFDSTVTLWKYSPITSVVNPTSEEIKQENLYPNPVRSSSILEFPLSNGSIQPQISVVTLLGETVAKISSIEVSGEIARAEISTEQLHLVAGRYFVRIQTGNGTRFVPFMVMP